MYLLKKYWKSWGGSIHAQVTNHKSREICTCTVRRFKLTTFSLAHTFITISPIQYTDWIEVAILWYINSWETQPFSLDWCWVTFSPYRCYQPRLKLPSPMAFHYYVLLSMLNGQYIRNHVDARPLVPTLKFIRTKALNQWWILYPFTHNIWLSRKCNIL
jgi:hypothetical protein